MKKNGIYEKILRRKEEQEKKRDPLITLNKSRTKRLEKAFFASIQQEEEEYLDKEMRDQLNRQFNF